MIRQGHRYKHGSVSVIALEYASSGHVKVAPIADPFIGLSYRVRVDALKPEPMKYFQGQTK